MTVEVRPLTRHIGAELHGIDLAGHFDEAAFESLLEALLDHHVVFAPKQFLGPADLLRVALWFGEILRNPLSPKVKDFPDVTELVTYDGRAPDIWHFDTSYADVPPKASLLSMVKSRPSAATRSGSACTRCTSRCPRLCTTSSPV